MSKSLIIPLVLFSAGVVCASPIIRKSSVSLSQSGTGAKVVISYSLDGDPAVITLEILTNGVPIAATDLSGAKGILGRRVEPGTHEIVWNVRKALPGRVLTGVSAKVTAWALNCPPPYMVLSTDGVTKPVYYADTNSIPHWGESSNRLYKTSKIAFRRIPSAGVRWRMGSAPAEPGRSTDAAQREVVHDVTLSEDFYMAVYPVTQRQYALACGFESDSGFRGLEDSFYRPVEKRRYVDIRGSSPDVDWPTTTTNVAPRDTVGLFRRSTLCDTLDLPTEAEWEFACRAGAVTPLHTGDQIDDAKGLSALSSIGWHVGNSEAQTHEVGLRDPNPFGLYDMHGNVWEWCLDWISDGDAYSDGSHASDPVGASSGTHRVCRGGSWKSTPGECRAAYRHAVSPTAWHTDAVIGFRFRCDALVK